MIACPCCGAAVEDAPGSQDLTACTARRCTSRSRSVRPAALGITLPRLPAAELAGFYPESYGPYDAASGVAVARISSVIQRWQGDRALRTPPLRALAGTAPGRLLDVGCGRGDLGAYLIARGWTVTGIEPSANAAEAARARGLDARRGTLDDVELESGAYDAAVFRHSLEHLTDPVEALRRVREALRPGGLVLISVPNFGCWQRRRFGSRWYHLDLPRHRVHFTRQALGRALERAGFEPATITISTSSVGLPASIQYALAGRCLFPSGLPLRVAVALTTLVWPIARVADQLGGDGDVLNASARRLP